MTTRRDLLRHIGTLLEPLYGPAEARQIALTALSARTGIAPAALLADPGAPLDLPDADVLAAGLAAGRPLQYVLGFTDFFDLRIGVREGALIPRPETEELVAWIVAENPAAHHLLDVGTGSGCIALALKHLLPAATVCGADLSPEALAIARANAAALGLEVNFRRADALQTDTGNAARGKVPPHSGCNHNLPHTQHPRAVADQNQGTFKAPDASMARTQTQITSSPGLPHMPGASATADKGLHPSNILNTLHAPTSPDAPTAQTTPSPQKQVSATPPNESTGSQAMPSAAPSQQTPTSAEGPALSLSEVFSGPFDVIVSNPPYIPASERAAMRRNVTDYEPHQALFVPDNDPLCFYRAIAYTASSLLAPGGTLYFEIHERYGDAVCRLLTDAGFAGVELRHDFRGKPRMIRARKTTAP